MAGDPEIQGAVIEHAQADLANVPGATGRMSHQEDPAPVSYTEAIRDGIGAIFDAADALGINDIIAKGADELAQGMFTGNAYVMGLGPMDIGGTEPQSMGPASMEQESVHGAEAPAVEPMGLGGSPYGQAVEGPAVEPMGQTVEPPSQGSYEEALNAYGMGGYDQGMGQDQGQSY